MTIAMDSKSAGARLWNFQLGLVVVPLAIVAIVGTMFFLEPRFFSRMNLLNILRNFSLGSIVAIGQMLVLMVGGFDMAIGASAALAAIVAAWVMLTLVAGGMGDFVVGLTGVAAGLAASAMLGLFNSQVVIRFKITPFMATLATGSMAMGATFYFTNGVPVYGVPESFIAAVGRNSFAGIPVVCWIAAAFVAIAWWVMDATPVGQHVRGVGGNERAAAAAGIQVSRIKLLAYTASSLSGGLLGILLLSRVGSGDPSFGAASAIESIAAAVLGGTMLGGGVGKISRLLPAVLLLAICSNALNLARVDSKWQACALGIILIGAVLLENSKRQR